MENIDPDLEILKSHLKPFLKDNKFELDSNSELYNQISPILCNFLEGIAFKNKTNQTYNKIFNHLLNYAHLDVGRTLVNYSNLFIRKEIEKFLQEIFLKENFKESYFHKEFLDTISTNKPITLNQEILIETDNIFKENILSNNSMINFLKNSTIHQILEKCQIRDIINEKFLTEIRRIILERIINSKTKEDIDIKNFSSKLSYSCFFNEYSWLEDNEETKNINLLEKRIHRNLKESKKIIFSEIYILSSYRPLFSFKNLIKFFLKIENPVIKNQVLNFVSEEKIIKKIKTLLPIENTISLNVKNQYEEYPYPRWDIFQKNTNNIKYYDYINLETSDRTKPKKVKKILVAGCGTGRHAISISMIDPSVKIDAIDLSKKSLAYAYRKSEELNIKNINWIHGDILDLESLRKRYDVIESVGVLHHMESPKKGLNVLSKILEARGLLKLGLYSRTYRNNLKPAKKFLADNNYSRNLKSIQEARRQIIKSKEDNIKYPSIYMSDFYTTSAFVDLLIHEQELDFNIDDLVDLYKKEFNFLGFTITEQKKRQFDNSFKKIDVTDNEMENWKKLEKIDNYFFSNMYQFWVQKK